MVLINCLDAVKGRWLQIKKLVQIQSVEKPLADIIWDRDLFRGGLIQGYRFAQSIDNDAAVVTILHMQFDLVAQLLGQLSIVVSRE